jgi:hypothetical protein
MLTREIPVLAAQAGDCDRTLPFEKPDYRRDRVFGRNGDAHVCGLAWDAVQESGISFAELARENLSQLTARLPKITFRRRLDTAGTVLAVHF